MAYSSGSITPHCGHASSDREASNTTSRENQPHSHDSLFCLNWPRVTARVTLEMGAALVGNPPDVDFSPAVFGTAGRTVLIVEGWDFHDHRVLS